MTKQDEQDFKRIVIEALASKEGQRAIVKAMKSEKKFGRDVWKKILKLRELEREKRMAIS